MLRVFFALRFRHHFRLSFSSFHDLTSYNSWDENFFYFAGKGTSAGGVLYDNRLIACSFGTIGSRERHTETV